MISKTPKPPYYAVIFTSLRTDLEEGYDKTADRMVELAKEQKGFLGMETARTEIGITISYWKTLEDIHIWKNNEEHKAAQKNGKDKWYAAYKIRICRVERDYEF
jgi:heme-degrading monooxygenase HmoA